MTGEILCNPCVLGDISCQGDLEIIQPTGGFLEAPGFGGGFDCYLAAEACPAFQQRDCQPCLCVHIFSLTKSTRLLTPGGQKAPDQVVQVHAHKHCSLFLHGLSRPHYKQYLTATLLMLACWGKSCLVFSPEPQGASPLAPARRNS